MKRKVLIIIASVMLVAGIGLLLFPIVSNFVGQQIAENEVNSFDAQISNIVDDGTSYEQAKKEKKIDDSGYPIDKNGKRTSDNPVIFKADLDRLWKDSTKYNENLKSNQNSLLISDYSYVNPSLDLNSYGITNGIYGYVSAPSINMKLPIFLGASNSNMSYGAAHLTYTSLPIGGDKTNTVLAGHTGYIGRIFFDNLRNLKIGNKVELHNFWDNISYKVVETKVCKPNESSDIFLKNGKDLLTMITCINNNDGGFDRYYVICERTK